MYIATRTIDWALNPPYNDRLFLKEGEEVECLENPELIEKLLNIKYIKHVVDLGEDVEPHDVEKELFALVHDIIKNEDKKKALEDWGKTNANIDISRRKSVKNIIKDLVKAVG